MRLQSVSESIKIVNESHVDTDQMMYADAIAKVLQTNKSELGNVWTAEIIDASSDFVGGSGGGRIKYIRPAVPDEVDFSITIENRKSPEPKIGEDGLPIPDSGDNVQEETGDVKVTVSINDNPAVEETFKDQALASITQVVTDFVVATVNEHHQKQKVAVTESKSAKSAKLPYSLEIASDMLAYDDDVSAEEMVEKIVAYGKQPGKQHDMIDWVDGVTPTEANESEWTISDFLDKIEYKVNEAKKLEKAGKIKQSLGRYSKK